MDRTTDMLAAYACRLSFEDLGPKTVHQVKRTLVDTMGCAMGGFVSEPAKIARGMASSITSTCLLYTSPSPRDLSTSRMPSSA